MAVEHLEHVDGTLLLISAAREQAERAGRESGDEGLVDALGSADRELLRIYNELMRAVYFKTPATASQLKLA